VGLPLVPGHSIILDDSAAPQAPPFLLKCAAMQVIRAAVSLIVRSAVLSARYAGQQRLLLLHEAATVGGDASELAP
jgi:hypothetical protein